MKSTVLMAGFILIFSTGCEKFLTAVPTGTQTVDAVFTSVAEGNALIIGPYRRQQDWLGGAGDFGNGFASTLEFAVGKAYTADSHSLFINFQNNQISGSMLNDFSKPWGDWYGVIRDCNFTISRIPTVKDFSEAQKKSGLGEARTLRAFYYLNLVRMFGDVVKVLGPIASISEAEQPRSSLKEIFDEIIIPDLEYAVNEAGLNDVLSTGRVTKPVARVILADAYLTAAGYPYQEVATDPTKEWCAKGLWTMSGYPVNTASSIAFYKKAQEQLNAIVSSGKYKLGTYDDIHNPAMNNKEWTIWQIQFLENNPQLSYATSITSHTSWNSEYGTFVPSLEYYQSYSSADKRAQERQFFYTTDNISSKYDVSEPPGPKFQQPHLYKLYDVVAIKSTNKSSLGWSHYRYADVLLMQTEVNWALRKLGQTVTDAEIITGINLVRAVATLPEYSATTLTLENIMAERAYELVFENKMIWDYRRTRTALKDGSGAFTIEPFIGHRPTGFNFSFSAMNLLSPVSGPEILANKKALQNFGYLPKQATQ